MNSLRPLKVALWLAIATMAFMIMASSSPQCARSDSNPLSPGYSTLAGPDPVKACERDCKADARVATREERRRHRLAGKACNGDQACHDAEDATNLLNLAEIAADEAGCIEACQHQQGAATGGQ